MTELRGHGLGSVRNEIHRVYPRGVHCGEDHEGNLTLRPNHFRHLTMCRHSLSRLYSVRQRANYSWTMQQFQHWSWSRAHEGEMIAR